MNGERKQALQDLSSLKSNFRVISYNKKVIVSLVGQDQYDSLSSQFSEMFTKLTERIAQLPIGKRYTGTFYFKKPYTQNTVTIKIDGSAFMREDLVSWYIDPPHNENHDVSYLRTIYKDAVCSQAVTLDDAKYVFETIKEIEEV